MSVIYSFVVVLVSCWLCEAQTPPPFVATAVQEFASVFQQRRAASGFVPLELRRPAGIFTGRALLGNRRKAGTRSARELKACAWNITNAVCLPSGDRTADYLSKAKGDFAHLLAPFAECQGAQKKKECRSVGQCLWDSLEERCHFVDITKERKTSPCVQSAPWDVGRLVHVPSCGAHTTVKACSRSTHCKWDVFAGKCGYDVFKPLFGVSLDEYSQALLVMNTAWQESFWKNFNIGDADSDWIRVLEWQVPKASCPKGFNPTACKLANLSGRHHAPLIYYCAYRYSIATAGYRCSVDPLCEVDAVHKLCVARSTHSDAIVPFLKGTLSLVRRDMDRKILAKLAECVEIMEPTKCIGKCLWSEVDDVCVVRNDWSYTTIATVDKKSADAVCTYLSLAAASGCVDFENQNDCNTLPNCSWRPLDQVCLPSVESLIESAIDEEPKLAASYSDLQRQCQAQESKKDCLAAIT